jgi:hypothetical protein
MKKALIEYSNARVVPDNSDSQPASGRAATPARPVRTASARSTHSVGSRWRSWIFLSVVFFWRPVPESTPQPLTTATPDQP